MKFLNKAINYAFTDENICTNRDTWEITVNPVPNHPNVANTTRCGPGSLTLSASGGGTDFIRLAPDQPSVASTSRCGPGNLTLAASGGGEDNVKYVW